MMLFWKNGGSSDPPPQVMRVVEGPRTDPGEILYDRALDHSDKCETKTRPDTEPQ